MPSKANKKKLLPAPVPTIASFFEPKREYDTNNITPKAPEVRPVNPFHKPPPLLYDSGSGLAYAEVVDGRAFCLDSGAELFKFKNRDDDDDAATVCIVPSKALDFTPPAGKRHPDDRWVDVAGLVEFGLLSDEDVSSRKGFTAEQLRELMDRLAVCRGERA